MELLKRLCSIHAPSGDEFAMTNFLLDYIETNKQNWKVQPTVYSGGDFQDSVVLVFGEPRTAVFSHIDTVGFTVRYGGELIKIGSPKAATGTELVGSDSRGFVACTLCNDEETDDMRYELCREIDRGTSLTYKPNFKELGELVQSPYMDNRLGVWTSLRLAETLQNGIIAFTCWEEHGSGSAQFVARWMYEQLHVRQALIADITWITEGVTHGNGVVISLRDSTIPRRSYVNRIIGIANQTGIRYQLEVESAGGSDGTTIQKSPYPIDWCFVGAAEDNVHSPQETVHRDDIASMLALYQNLMKEL